MKKNILNIKNIDWVTDEHGDFAYQGKWLSEPVLVDYFDGEK